MQNFIKQTFASVVGTILGLFIFFGFGTTSLLMLLFAASRDLGPVVKDKSVLVFDLSTKITDAQPSSSDLFQNALSNSDEQTMNLRTVLDTLEKAGRDKRIVGIYLDGTRASAGDIAGFATLKEIRKGLEKFRATGKKIVAYGMDWGEKGYYLSSVADNITVNPLGAIEINGLSSQPLFLSGALDKYGIGVQVVRVGKFKGAVETFTLTKLSPENRQQIQRLLNDVWTEWRTVVASSRKTTPLALQAIADNQAYLNADEAKTNGLVDNVGYFDEVVADLKKLTGDDKDEKTFRQISLSEYALVRDKSLATERTSKNKIAVVYAEGEIVGGKSESGVIAGDRFAKILRKLRQDSNVKAIVLRINSPGGSATAAEVIQRELQLIGKDKPVIVSMGDVAASGGYWIASDAKRIFAEPNTITGSIGVFGLLLNAQKLANDNGITWDSVKTGSYADTETISRPKTDQELAIYQRNVNRVYSLFLGKVAQGRKLPEAKVAEIAQGRIWSGTAAKEIGLVDEIGGLDAAIAYAAKQTKLGKDWELQEYPRFSSWKQRLFGQVNEEVRTTLKLEQAQMQAPNFLTAEFQKLQAEIGILQNMNEPQGIYARLPFNLKIE